MRVLIIEDVDSMRELLEHVIRESGKYQLSGSARNGAEARFELVRRRPDLVLLDEILPGESSFDLLEEFRLDQIPVVLLTSLKGRSAEEVPLPPGALGRLFKPEWRTVSFDGPRLCGELDQALKSKG